MASTPLSPHEPPVSPKPDRRALNTKKDAEDAVRAICTYFFGDDASRVQSADHAWKRRRVFLDDKCESFNVLSVSTVADSEPEAVEWYESDDEDDDYWEEKDTRPIVPRIAVLPSSHRFWGANDIDNLIDTFLKKHWIPNRDEFIAEARLLLVECNLGIVYHYSPLTRKLAARCSWKTLQLLEPVAQSMFLRAFGFNTRAEWAMRKQYTTIGAISTAAKQQSPSSSLWLNDDERSFYDVTGRPGITDADRALGANIASLYHFSAMRTYGTHQCYYDQHAVDTVNQRRTYDHMAVPIFDAPSELLDSIEDRDAKALHERKTCAQWLDEQSPTLNSAIWDQLQGMLEPSHARSRGLLPFAMRILVLDQADVVYRVLGFDMYTRQQLPDELGRFYMAPADTLYTNYADLVTMPERVRNARYDSCNAQRLPFFRQIPFTEILDVARIVPQYPSATAELTYYVSLRRLSERDEETKNELSRSLYDARAHVYKLQQSHDDEQHVPWLIAMCDPFKYGVHFPGDIVNDGDFLTKDPDGGAIVFSPTEHTSRAGRPASRLDISTPTYFSNIVVDLLDNKEARTGFAKLHSNPGYAANPRSIDTIDCVFTFGESFDSVAIYRTYAERAIKRIADDVRYDTVEDARRELVDAGIAASDMTRLELTKAYHQKLDEVVRSVFFDPDVIRFFTDRTLSASQMADIYSRAFIDRLSQFSQPPLQMTPGGGVTLMRRREQGISARRAWRDWAPVPLFVDHILKVLVVMLQNRDALTIDIRGMYYGETVLQRFFTETGVLSYIEHLRLYRIQKVGFQMVRFLRFYTSPLPRPSLFDRFVAICGNEQLDAVADAVRTYDQTPSAVTLFQVGTAIDNAADDDVVKKKRHLLVQELLFENISYAHANFSSMFYFIYQLLSYVPVSDTRRASAAARGWYYALPQNAINDLIHARSSSMRPSRIKRWFNHAKLHITEGESAENEQGRTLCANQWVLSMVETMQRSWQRAAFDETETDAYDVNVFLTQLFDNNAVADLENNPYALKTASLESVCLTEIRLLRAVHDYLDESGLYTRTPDLVARFNTYQQSVRDALKLVRRRIRHESAADTTMRRSEYERSFGGMGDFFASDEEESRLDDADETIVNDIFVNFFQNGDMDVIAGVVRDNVDANGSFVNAVDSNELGVNDTVELTGDDDVLLDNGDDDGDDTGDGVPVNVLGLSPVVPRMERQNAVENDDAWRELIGNARRPHDGHRNRLMERMGMYDDSSSSSDDDSDGENRAQSEFHAHDSSGHVPPTTEPTDSAELRALLADYRARNAPSIERIQEQAKIAETEVRCPVDLVERFNELYFEFVNDRAHNRVGAEHLEPLDKLIAATRRSSAAHAALVRQAAYRVHEDIQRQLGVNELLVENSALLDNPHVRAMRETRWPMEKKYADDVADATSSASSASLEQAVHTLSDPYFLPAYQQHLAIDTIAAERRQNPCIRATLDRQRRALAAIGLTDARLADATLARDRKAWRDAYDRARCAVDADEEAYALLFEQGGFNFLVVSGEIALSDEDEEKARLLANLQKEDVVSF